MRAVVPHDLVEHFGRREVWKSLRTSDRRRAEVAILAETSKLLHEFSMRRKELAQPQVQADLDDHFLLGLAQKLADILDNQVKEYPYLSRCNYTEETGGLKKYKEDLQSQIDFHMDMLTKNSFDRMEHELYGCLVDNKVWHLEPGSHEWSKLGSYLARVIIRDLKKELNEFNGIFAHGVVDPLFDKPDGRTRSASSKNSLGALIDQYWRENHTTWSAKTLDTYESIRRLILLYFGKDKAIADITRDDCRQFRDDVVWLPYGDRPKSSAELKQECQRNREKGLNPRGPKTLERYIGLLSAILRYAVREGKLDRNPAERLLVGMQRTSKRAISSATVYASEKRRPFQIEELNTIFSAEAYRKSHPMSSLRWAPVLSLFHGLRLNEALQIEPSDVSYIDNVLCVHITDEVTSESRGEKDGVKRLKNTASRRVIPIHPDVQELGFIDLWQRARALGLPRLMVDLHASPHGYYSDVFSKRFGRFIRDIGVSSRGVVFHSFRHTFRDAARVARIPKDITYQIGGWSTHSVGDDYGQGYPMSILQSELRKIQFPNLVIPRADGILDAAAPKPRQKKRAPRSILPAGVASAFAAQT